MNKNYVGKNDLVFVRCKTGDAEIIVPEIFPVERKTKKPEQCLFGLFGFYKRLVALLDNYFPYENLFGGIYFQVVNTTGKFT
jgi:hypothetical protein